MRRSIRRQILDQYLENAKSIMKGRVLDVGGIKESRRGNFRPPLDQVDGWEYLNLDETTNPDYCCSADNIPLESNSIDTVLLCEVLEHVENPDKVISEIARILKPGGKLILSIPFMYQIHLDPDDFQRYTDSKLQKLLSSHKIRVIEIKPMGYYFSVLADILFNGIKKIENKFLREFLMATFYAFNPLLAKLDNRVKKENYRAFTTGFFVVGEKRDFDSLRC